MIDENQVITAIDSLLATVSELKERHKLIPSSFTKYPASYIVPVSWEESFADLRDTQVDAVFKIGIVYSLQPNLETAQTNLRNAVKEVREVLGNQDNTTLSGIVDSSRLTSGTYSFDTTEQRIAMCEILLTVRKRFNRYQ